MYENQTNKRWRTMNYDRGTYATHDNVKFVVVIYHIPFTLFY
jgi:hypothetical protein